MRIVFVNPSAGLGGAERSLLDMLASLTHRRPDIELGVVLFEAGPLEALARDAGARVWIVPLPDELASLGEAGLRLESARAWLARPGGHAPFARMAAFGGLTAFGRFAREFRRVVHGFRPDLVHTNGFKAHFATALLARRLPSVAHARDFVSSRPVSRWLVRALPRARFAIVANSEAVRRDVARLLPRTRVELIHNAIDVDRFADDREPPADLARLAGLAPPSPNTVTVGLVATYARWKGQPLFLEAAARARALSRVPLRFYIVGGPQYRTAGSQYTKAELEQTILRLGLETSAGLVPFQGNPAPVYRALDVLVHASTEPEPFGRTIVEGMAAGCAVVVASAGGAVELFRPDVSGLGFPPGDVAALANVIVRLSEDPERRRRLSGRARAEARQRFGLERLGQELLAAYARALAEHR